MKVNETLEKAIQHFRILQRTIYTPLLQMCSTLHIQPDHITYSRIPLAVFIAWWLPTYPLFTAFFIALAIFLDTLDGALARFLNLSSLAGRYKDVITDLMVFIGFLIGTLNAGISPRTLTIAYLISYPLLVVLYLAAQMKNPKGWAIHPFSGFLEGVLFKAVFYLAFLFYLLTGKSLFNPILYFMLPLTFFLFILYLFSLRPSSRNS